MRCYYCGALFRLHEDLRDHLDPGGFCPEWRTGEKARKETMGYTVWPDGEVGDVLQDVYRERLRQEKLKSEGKFLWTCADGPPIRNEQKLAVLAEEFGEVSKEVVEELIAHSKGLSKEMNEARLRLRKELVQVAAVCIAWLESMPRSFNVSGDDKP